MCTAVHISVVLLSKTRGIINNFYEYIALDGPIWRVNTGLHQVDNTLEHNYSHKSEIHLGYKVAE